MANSLKSFLEYSKEEKDRWKAQNPEFYKNINEIIKSGKVTKRILREQIYPMIDQYNQEVTINKELYNKYSPYISDEVKSNDLLTSYGKRTTKNASYKTPYSLEQFQDNIEDYRQRLEEADLQSDLLHNSALIKDEDFVNNSPFLASLSQRKIDSEKGTGSKELWDKIMSMTTDGKQELLDQGWKTPNEIEKAQKAIWEANQKSPQSMQSAYGMAMATNTAMENVKNNNDKLFDDIYTKDAERQAEDYKNQVNKTTQEILENKTADEIDQMFMKAITPNKDPNNYNFGDREFAPYFNSTEEFNAISKFNINDKVRYLAKYAVYYQNLSPEVAITAIEKESSDYIKNHTSWWNQLNRLGRDIIHGGANYAIGALTAVKSAVVSALGGTYDLYTDGYGHFYGENQIKYDPSTNAYYDDQGNKVYKTKVEAATLEQEGKGVNGDGDVYDISKFWNQKYWNDVEMYNTFDSNKINQWKEWGAISPYRPKFDTALGELGYESAKMSSFILTDLALGAMGNGVIKSVGQTAKAMGKALTTINKTTDVAERIVNGANMARSAISIGNAYGTGVYAESIERNLATLDQAVSQQAYNDVRGYLQDTDSEVYKEFAALQNQYYKEIKAQHESANTDNKIIIDDEKIQNIAQNKAFETLVSQRYNILKNTSQYSKGLEEAYQNATNSAIIDAIGESGKYLLINKYGYRSVFFKNFKKAEQAAQQRLINNRYIEEIEQAAKPKAATTVASTTSTVEPPFVKRLRLKDKQTVPSLLKQASKQMWGGAWTNYTDEMQSAGAKQMNADWMDFYIAGAYNAEAVAYMNANMGPVLSYLVGGLESYDEEQTVNAGIVGGLGSAMSLGVNFSRMIDFITNNNINWSNLSTAEKFNLFLSNSILENYIQEKHAQSSVQRTIDIINKMLDNNDDFKKLSDVIGLDLLKTDIAQTPDKYNIETSTLVDALQSYMALKQLRELEHFGIVDKSTILQQAQHLQELLTKENLTEEETNELLEEYYNHNEDIVHTEENNQKALNEIFKTKQLFQELESLYETTISPAIEKIKTNYKNDTGQELSSLEINTLPAIERLLASYYLAQRQYNQNEVILQGQEGNADFFHRQIPDTDRRAFGNKDSQIKINGIAQTQVQQQLQAVNEALEKAKAEVTDIESKHGELQSKHVRATEEVQTKYQKAKEQVQLLEKQKEQIEEALNILVANKEKIDKLSEVDSENGVLSEEEILALNPVDRAFMLKPKNYKLYSAEQQKVIHDLYKKLKKNNQLDMLYNQDLLYGLATHLNQNIERLTEKPAEETTVLQSFLKDQSKTEDNIRLFRYLQEVDDNISQLNNKGYDSEQISTAVKKAFSAFKPDYWLTFKSFIDNYAQYFPTINQYQAEINTAYDVAINREFLKSSILKLENQQDVYDLLNQLLPQTADAEKAEDIAEILNNLKNNTEISEQDKQLIEQVLNNYEALINQEKSAPLEVKEKLDLFEQNKKVIELKETREKKAKEEAEQREKEEKERQQLAQDKAQLEADRKQLEQDKKQNEVDIQKQQEAIEKEKQELEKKQKDLKEQQEQLEQNRNDQDKDQAELDKQQKALQKQQEEITKQQTKLSEKKQALTKNKQALAEKEQALAKREQVLAEKEQALKTEQERLLQERQRQQEIEEQQRKAQEALDLERQAAEAEISTQSDGVLIGNALYRYEVKPLENQEDGTGSKLVKRSEKTGVLRDFHEFIENSLGYNLQSIIDHELHKFKDKDVQVITINPNANAADIGIKKSQKINKKRLLSTTQFLAIEYTDNVAQKHDETFGKPITATDAEGNTKKYLLIGTVGYSANSSFRSTSRRSFDFINEQASSFWQEHQDVISPYGVVPKVVTHINNITSGRLVKSIGQNSSPVTIHTVGELLGNVDSNPLGLTWEDLRFGFITNPRTGENVKDPIYQFLGEEQYVSPLKTKFSQGVGQVFMHIPNSRGLYIPIYIRKTLYTDKANQANKENRAVLQEGSELKKTIDTLFLQLSTPNQTADQYNQIITQLQQYLWLSTLPVEGRSYPNTIYRTIRYVEKTGSIIVYENDAVVRVFNINKEGFNQQAMLEYLHSTPFEINLNMSNLINIDFLKMLDAAGGLTTDIAILGTKNANYTINTIGNTIDSKTGNYTEVRLQREQNQNSFTDAKLKVAGNTVYLQGVPYRYSEDYNIWTSESGRDITDIELIDKLNIARKLAQRLPSYSVDNTDTYIIEDTEGTYVVRVDKQGNITKITNPTVVKSIIDYYDKYIQKKKARESNIANTIESAIESLAETTQEAQERVNSEKRYDIQSDLEKSLTSKKKDVTSENIDNTPFDFKKHSSTQLSNGKLVKDYVREKVAEKSGKDKDAVTNGQIKKWLQAENLIDENGKSSMSVKQWCEILEKCH